MTAAEVFAVAVGMVAFLLGVAAVRRRRLLEFGISAIALAVSLLLAVMAGLPDIPVGLTIVAVWLVVVLSGLAAWSLIRHADKQRTGEDTR